MSKLNIAIAGAGPDRSALYPTMRMKSYASNEGALAAEPLRKVKLEMLRLLSRGLTNQEIANKLAITVGTTKWRMNQIFGKLQVRNRIEALARASQLQKL